MRFLIGLLLIVGGAVALSLVAGANNGYALLVQPPYRIELSLNLLMILQVLVFVGLYALLHLIFYTLHLPEKVRQFKTEQRHKKAHELLLESMHALAEGRYGKAEKTAERVLKLGETPELSALIAARAAHKLKDFSRRDFYLAEAERLAPDFEVGRLLLQAELLLDERSYAQALAVLQRLERREAKHLPALGLELKVQQHLGNWEQVLHLVQHLEKRDAIELLQAQQLKRHAHQALLEYNVHDRDELLAYWKKVPEADRLDSKLAALAAHGFITAGDSTMAAQIVEMSLTRQWDGELARLYGECNGEDTPKQLQQAEYWLQQHHGDAGLLLSLGNLCLRQELWGKAQSYLEASLSVAPCSAAHLALAKVAERLGNSEEACRRYQQSLALALSEHKRV